MKKFVMCFVIAVSMLFAGCDDGDAPIHTPVKEQQAVKAQQAAQSIQFTENAEIENIKKRIELTANPGLLGFIVLLNESGQPVMYTSVKGKVTSGSKRLTKTYEVDSHWDCGSGAWCDKELPAPSDEGTYGSSGEYVFFWTTSGQYVQWNGKYLYSDKPIRLSVQPLVVNVVEKGE